MFKKTLCHLALPWLLATTPVPGVADDPYVTLESDAPFQAVMDGLKLAIENQGMYINNVMHLGEMLERTGRDLGFDEQIYRQAQSIEFCSALLSRRMTAEDPRRIVNCPFIIAVYVLPDQPDRTYLAYRRLAGPDAAGVMKEVMEMFENLVAAAAEGF